MSAKGAPRCDVGCGSMSCIFKHPSSSNLSTAPFEIMHVVTRNSSAASDPLFKIPRRAFCWGSTTKRRTVGAICPLCDLRTSFSNPLLPKASRECWEYPDLWEVMVDVNAKNTAVENVLDRCSCQQPFPPEHAVRILRKLHSQLPYVLNLVPRRNIPCKQVELKQR